MITKQPYLKVSGLVWVKAPQSQASKLPATVRPKSLHWPVLATLQRTNQERRCPRWARAGGRPCTSAWAQASAHSARSSAGVGLVIFLGVMHQPSTPSSTRGASRVQARPARGSSSSASSQAARWCLRRVRGVMGLDCRPCSVRANGRDTHTLSSGGSVLSRQGHHHYCNVAVRGTRPPHQRIARRSEDLSADRRTRVHPLIRCRACRCSRRTARMAFSSASTARQGLSL